MKNGNSIANTQITISIDGKTYNVTTNSNGEWSFAFTPTSSGNFSTTIFWTSNSTHRGFTNSTTLNVAKIPTIITVTAPNTEVGKTISIHGILFDEEGKPIANTLVTVTVDGKKYTVTTNENGLWNLPYKTTHTGNIEVSVSFEGNNIYLASQNTTIFNVKTINRTNRTNQTNETNNTNNNLNTIAAMKKTKIPIISILILLTSVFGISVRRKQR